MGLLDGGIKKQIGSALDGILLPFKLRRTTGDDYDEETGTMPDGNDTDYDCKGMVSTYKKSLIAEGLVSKNHRKILITAESLDVEPQMDDKIVDNEGKLWPILDIDSDPAGATWVIQSKV